MEAVQGGFYQHGNHVVKVDSTTFFNVRFKDAQFGVLKVMSWDEFAKYSLLPDVSNWEMSHQPFGN